MGLLKELLKPLAEDGAALTREQAGAVLREILAGEAPEVETAALLTVLATRGEQAPELAGFVDVMRERGLRYRSPTRSEQAVDCRNRRGRTAAFFFPAAAWFHAAKTGGEAR
jgi:anthranilate phosphoribosyltransferase